MLAIVIPYYKKEYFEATLFSLVHQSDKRFSLYIGNDNSPEDPSAILEKYRSQLQFKYKKFDTNFGRNSLVKQWKRCLQLVEDEDWVMVLGDDDYLSKNTIEAWYKYFPVFSDKSNVVRFASRLVNERNGHTSPLYENPVWEDGCESFFKRFKGLTRSSLSEYVFSKKRYFECGFQEFPVGWHSDDYAWLEFSGEKPIYSINEASIYIRLSSSSITGNSELEGPKAKAKEEFLKKVLTDKLHLFHKYQRHDLLLAYELAVKTNRIMEMRDWFYLLRLHIKNLKLISMAKFLRRFYLYLFR